MYDMVYRESHWDNGNLYSKGYSLGGVRLGYWEGYYTNGNLQWFGTYDNKSNLVGYSEDYTYSGDLCNKEFYL